MQVPEYPCDNDAARSLRDAFVSASSPVEVEGAATSLGASVMAESGDFGRIHDASMTFYPTGAADHLIRSMSPER
jgi:hypothetical protein